jgi:hypothetical protein
VRTMLSKCLKCNGTGFKELHGYQIPCASCNCRGIIADELYSAELVEFDKKHQ